MTTDKPRQTEAAAAPGRALAAELSAELERIEAATYAAIDAVAERVRTEIVAPACRKHRLQFTQGMGTFFFSRGDTPLERWDMEGKPRYADVLAALDVLDQTTVTGFPLGFRVDDVR